MRLGFPRGMTTEGASALEAAGSRKQVADCLPAHGVMRAGAELEEPVHGHGGRCRLVPWLGLAPGEVKRKLGAYFGGM